jgi:hypothetical protein
MELIMIVSVYNLISAVVQELTKSIQVWHMPNLKLSFKDAWTHLRLRAFFMPKITGLKRFVPVSLKGWMKNEKQNSRLCERLSNLDLDTRVKQRDQGLFSSCELISITKRLIVGEGQISTLIFYMKMILLGSRGKADLRPK